MGRKSSSVKALSIAASLLMTFSLVAPNVVSAETTSKIHQSFRDSSSNTISSEDKMSTRLLENFKAR